jgi:phage repressor protein C with HTH and peptisase S24 domain
MNSVYVYAMGKPKTVTAVRLDQDQLKAVTAMASERRIGVSPMVRQLVDAAMGMKPGDDPPIPSGDNHDAGRPEHTVPIPVVGVAAGGSPVESDDLREEYPLLRHLYKSGRYAIRLFGDSMWPTLWDHDLLLVEPVTSVPNGKIAVVSVRGGASMVKRVHRRKKDGSWTLRSDNPIHPLVEAEADEVAIVARFLKIVEGERS